MGPLKFQERQIVMLVNYLFILPWHCVLNWDDLHTRTCFFDSPTFLSINFSPEDMHFRVMAQLFVDISASYNIRWLYLHYFLVTSQLHINRLFSNFLAGP